MAQVGSVDRQHKLSWLGLIDQRSVLGTFSFLQLYLALGEVDHWSKRFISTQMYLLMAYNMVCGPAGISMYKWMSKKTHPSQTCRNNGKQAFARLSKKTHQNPRINYRKTSETVRKMRFSLHGRKHMKQDDPWKRWKIMWASIEKP